MSPSLQKQRWIDPSTGKATTRYVVTYGDAILWQGSSEAQALAVLARAKEGYGDEGGSE